MTLTGLILIPLALAALMALWPAASNCLSRHRVALAGALGLFGYSLWPLLSGAGPLPTEAWSWFPSLGIQFALGADGLSYSLVVLTTFLLVMAVVASWTNIHERLRLYYSILFLLIAGVLGVFLARDLFLYFLFWELELIPMYLLIAIWGGPRREFAAMKFILYTLFGSAFLVAALLGVFLYNRSIGVDPGSLFLFQSLDFAVQTGMPVGIQLLLFAGFFMPFAIKLPMVPFHTWLPDAHVEAPTPISMLLAGILLKMGAYGLLRFCFGFFPEAAQIAAPYVGLLAVINIVYTAGVALVQTDLKKLIAYSSVSHMGFVLLGLAALNATGFNGAVFVMLSHGIVSAALFMCVGTLYRRTHTRMIADYSGFAQKMPVLFYFFMLMSMASLGLPLLISFAGESLVFYGAFLSTAFQKIALGGLVLPWSLPQLTVFAAIGIVIGAAYLLWMLQRVFFGPLSEKWQSLKDATPSEVLVLATLSLLVIGFGIAPQWLVQQYSADVSRYAASFQRPYGAYVSQKKAERPPVLMAERSHP